MEKSELKICMRVVHSNLGEGIHDVDCFQMEMCNPDPSSTFISFNRELKEVSIHLLKEANDERT